MNPKQLFRSQGWLLLLAIALVVPPFLNRYFQDVLVFFGLYVLLGLSLNIIVGYTGLFNLGHAAFYAVGAYTVAILNTEFNVPVFVALPVAGGVAAAVGWLLSRPIVRLRGDYLALVTIGFSEIVRIALNNNPLDLTGGPNGIVGIDRPSLFGMLLKSPIQHYYMVLFFVVLLIWSMRRLEDSRIGRAWTYIREDEIAAEAMGIDTAAMKSLAFALGAGVAGVTGALYAGKMTVVSPDAFIFWESVVIFSIVILGGAGSIPGVILGAAGMMILPELFRGFVNWRMLVFGAAMVAMMVFRPAGLWPATLGRGGKALAPKADAKTVAAGGDGAGR